MICILLVLSLPALSMAQTKRALVIGLGLQQDRAWVKINGDKDVPYVEAMLKAAGFKSVTTLVNRQATKQAIVGAFKRLAASCRRGDVVYVHYSGHGQQMRDVHGDERDGLDECWIPYDACRRASASYHGEKHLTDDEVNRCLNAIRDRIGSDGKLLVVVDACHSGDATRGDDDEVERGVWDIFEAVKSLFTGGQDANPDAKPLPERWITIIACRSDQTNTELKSPAVGKLTYAIYKELTDGGKCGNAEFLKRISRFVDRNSSSRPQSPEMTGADIDKYNITDILGRK